MMFQSIVLLLLCQHGLCMRPPQSDVGHRSSRRLPGAMKLRAGRRRLCKFPDDARDVNGLCTNERCFECHPKGQNRTGPSVSHTYVSGQLHQAQKLLDANRPSKEFVEFHINFVRFLSLFQICINDAWRWHFDEKVHNHNKKRISFEALELFLKKHRTLLYTLGENLGSLEDEIDKNCGRDKEQEAKMSLWKGIGQLAAGLVLLSPVAVTMGVGKIFNYWRTTTEDGVIITNGCKKLWYGSEKGKIKKCKEMMDDYDKLKLRLVTLDYDVKYKQEISPTLSKTVTDFRKCYERDLYYTWQVDGEHAINQFYLDATRDVNRKANELTAKYEKLNNSHQRLRVSHEKLRGEVGVLMKLFCEHFDAKTLALAKGKIHRLSKESKEYVMGLERERRNSARLERRHSARLLPGREPNRGLREMTLRKSGRRRQTVSGFSRESKDTPKPALRQTRSCNVSDSSDRSKMRNGWCRRSDGSSVGARVLLNELDEKTKSFEIRIKNLEHKVGARIKVRSNRCIEVTEVPGLALELVPGGFTVQKGELGTLIEGDLNNDENVYVRWDHHDEVGAICVLSSAVAIFGSRI